MTHSRRVSPTPIHNLRLITPPCTHPLISAPPLCPPGFTYFYKGKEYWKFNNQRLRVEPGYPRSILKDFMGCDGTASDPARPGGPGGPGLPPDDGTSNVVIELDNTTGTVQAMAIVVPCVLLLCLLALVYTVVQFKRKGTPRHILYCKRSMQEWV